MVITGVPENLFSISDRASGVTYLPITAVSIIIPSKLLFSAYENMQLC